MCRLLMVLFLSLEINLSLLIGGDSAAEEAMFLTKYELQSFTLLVRKIN